MNYIEVIGTWFRRVKNKYQETEEAIKSDFRNRYPNSSGLEGAFSMLPLGGCTANLGPNTVTPLHRDMMNNVTGICVVSVFGDFDWENGGDQLQL